MHTPNPGSDPRPDVPNDNGDVRKPPVPPDQQYEIVPIEEPPKPGHSDAPPMRLTRTKLRRVPQTSRTLLIAGAIAVTGTLLPHDAQAEIRLTQRGCMMYSTWSGNLVWARDLGADKEKARAELIALDQKRPSSIYTLMLRELDALWSTSATWEDVTVLVLQDCISRGGRYESGT
jgi:hypothetical protein